MQKCKLSNDYKGASAPRCNGGEGCDACNQKYLSRVRAEMKRRLEVNIKKED